MKEWAMVRITRKPQRRLQALRELTLEQREKGRVMIADSGKPGGGLPTMDAVIRLLLDRDDKHRARARKQANRKKGYTEEPQLGQAEAIDVVPETPDEKFRAMYHRLAQLGLADELDSAEYRRVHQFWVQSNCPDWTAEAMARMTNCFDVEA